ncbi:MAG: hypothetical protein MUO21_08200 [Nitrososphaeraceae archaeon]|nr:hypothetical protein [Nitrososphaeraceae archaeon]
MGPRERLIIEKYYGLNNKIPLLFREIGKEMNIPRGRVSILKNICLKKMKNFVAKDAKLALGAGE